MKEKIATPACPAFVPQGGTSRRQAKLMIDMGIDRALQRAGTPLGLSMTTHFMRFYLSVNSRCQWLVFGFYVLGVT
jgi:hypothetical protein